jgi:hypothetical protein
MRTLSALVILLALAGCESEPGSQFAGLPQFITGLPGNAPEFGVSGLQQGQLPANYAAINNQSPDVPDQRAARVCTLGYQIVDQKPAPGDPIGFTVATVRCELYRPSL